MSKILVDEEKCIGCGACVAIDNEHFDFNDNGLSNVISNDNQESANLQSAIESCPTGAISVGDEKCNCCDECTNEPDCNCGCENCTCDSNDNGLSNVISNDNQESANLQSTTESCPTGAISVGDKKCNCCDECTGEPDCNCGCENCTCDSNDCNCSNEE